MEGVTSCEHNRVAVLMDMFPDSNVQELLRFCRARPQSIEEAAKMYEDYLEWRADKGSQEALIEASRAIPDKCIRSLVKGKDGNVALYVQGARFDETIDPELYVQACAHVMDSVFDASSPAKGSLFIDTRPGEGWNNPSAHKLLRFFRLAASELPRYFPERAIRIVIYPMPWIVVSIWKLVRNLFDPVIQDKFVVLSGPNDLGAPCPDGLSEFLSLEQFPQDARAMHQSLAT